jgi:2-methylisocitrate lyase-like PEP mutase family enzyme
MTTMKEKGRVFRDLHLKGELFVLANAWDAGSARLLECAGHVAIGTSSAGFAFSVGKLDNAMGRDAIVENGRVIADATSLPVSGDLEDGFGATPKDVEETIVQAARAGMVGGSIEDSTYDDSNPLYDIALAKDRIVAASQAAKALDFPFTLTARAENYLVDRRNLEDVIKRLQAYQDAGADVLYAPGVTDLEDIRSIVSSVDRPLNVLVGLPAQPPNLDIFRELGVARLSVGSGYARLAYGEAVRAAQSLLTTGSLAPLSGAMPYGEISRRLS